VGGIQNVDPTIWQQCFKFCDFLWVNIQLRHGVTSILGLFFDLIVVSVAILEKSDKSNKKLHRSKTNLACLIYI
jgi:hypothetical protein